MRAPATTVLGLWRMSDNEKLPDPLARGEIPVRAAWNRSSPAHPLNRDHARRQYSRKGGDSWSQEQASGEPVSEVKPVEPSHRALRRMQKRGGRGSHNGSKEQVNKQLLDEIVKLRGENDGIRDAYRASQELKEDLKEAAKIAEKAAKLAAQRAEEEQALELLSRLDVSFGDMDAESTYLIRWNYIAVAGVGFIMFALLPGGKIIGLVLFAVGLYFSFVSVVTKCSRYRYTFDCHVEAWSSVDRRPDYLATGDVKHTPKFAMVRFEDRREGTDIIMKVSLELLSHLTHGRILELGQEEKIVWERIKQASISIGSVGLDRYDTVAGNHVVAHTQIVALAIWKQLCENTAVHHFPRAPVIVMP